MAETRGNNKQKVIEGSAEKGNVTVHDKERELATTKRALKNAFEQVVKLAALKRGLEKAVYSNGLNLDTWSYVYSMAKEAGVFNPAFEELNDKLMKHLSIIGHLDTPVQDKREGEQGASGGGDSGEGGLFKGDAGGDKPEDELEELRKKWGMLNIDEGHAPTSRSMADAVKEANNLRDFVKELGAKVEELEGGVDQLQLKVISMVMDSAPADLRTLLEQGSDPDKVLVDYNAKKFFNPEAKSSAQETDLDHNSLDETDLQCTGQLKMSEAGDQEGV